MIHVDESVDCKDDVDYDDGSQYAGFDQGPHTDIVH